MLENNTKILLFSGGLGNQLFCYSFYRYLSRKYTGCTIYGFYPNKMLNEHYGLEIDKWFNVHLPACPWWIKFFLFVLYFKKKILKQDVIDNNMRVCQDENKKVFIAFKQNIRYYNRGYNIRFRIANEDLDERNRQICENITSTNSVFIHVRRGDYLSEQYRAKYEGTCPIEYYNKAIDYIKKKVRNPKYFIFSDDIDWVKENIEVDGTYITWNKGENSPIDMYLMSLCKYAIIANSTFSYWGAMLGTEKKIICYPLKWENSIQGSPEIFPKDWISL